MTDPGIPPAGTDAAAVDSIERYRRALHRRPGDAALRRRIGAALFDLDRLDEAEVWLRQAAEAVPPDPPAALALGSVLLHLGRAEEALAWFRTGRSRGDTSTELNLGEGLAQLTLGQLAAGWEGYEYRPVPQPFLASTAMPRWSGAETVRGRTVLVWAEQGLGDSLQFARYLPMLQALGARVLLVAPPPLRRLLAPLVDATVTEGDHLSCDLHCPLLSLPRAFATRLDSIPADVPYLAADLVAIAHWRRRLGPGRHVGLAWSGNPAHPHDRRRTLGFAALAPLFAVPGITWHVLQKEIRAEDAPALAARPEVRVHTGALGDFADTAALACALELVIAADTSVAHLAGALAVPVWIMLPFAADFRWLRARADSPWYPTARLFRQTRRGDWAPVVADIAAEIAALPAR